MNNFSVAREVQKYYPKATIQPKQGGKKWFQVWNENILLGQGQNRRCALEGCIPQY